MAILKRCFFSVANSKKQGSLWIISLSRCIYTIIPTDKKMTIAKEKMLAILCPIAVSHNSGVVVSPLTAFVQLGSACNSAILAPWIVHRHPSICAHRAQYFLPSSVSSILLHCSLVLIPFHFSHGNFLLSVFCWCTK